MKRDRGYYRSQRKRTIRRKSFLLYGIGGQDYWFAWTRGANGRLAKGKIHCSCPMCRSKSYDDPSARDKRAKGKAKEMINEYLREEETPNAGSDPEEVG